MNVEPLNFLGINRILLFRFIAFSFMLSLGSAAMAQVKFNTIISNKEVGRSDYVQIEFVVENAKQIEHFTPPAIPEDFNVVEGPMQSSGMSIVNGNMSQYKAVSFILQPTKLGKFSIQGATAEIDGKKMQSNQVTIQVNANSSGNTAKVNPLIQPTFPPSDTETDDKEYVLRPGENIVEEMKKNLFLKVQLSKNSCYVGEPIVATYKLYSRLRSESRVTKQPSLNGFSVYDMIDPGTDASSVETLNGKAYTVHTIRKAQLIPLQAGPVELSQVEVENTVHFLKPSGKRPHSNSILQNLLDQLGEGESGEDIQQNITLTSKPLVVNVKALPETNKPSNFNGAVGDFNMAVSIENKNITAQDAATLKLSINGSGNLPVIDAPQVNWPSSVDVFNTSSKEDIDNTVSPMKGSKTFEYVFIPKAAGSYTIPPVEFSYFDPANNIYKTINSEALSFNAAPAKKQTTTYKSTADSGNNNGLWNNMKGFMNDHLQWLFGALIVFVTGLFLWKHNTHSLKKEDDKKQADLVLENQKQEIELAKMPAPEPIDPLIRAKQLLEDLDYRRFYTELNHVLWDTLITKFDLPASEMNKQNITSLLRAKGWEEENIFKLQDILNKCEMNLYTPDHSRMDTSVLLRNTEQVIKYINEV